MRPTKEPLTVLILFNIHRLYTWRMRLSVSPQEPWAGEWDTKDENNASNALLHRLESNVFITHQISLQRNKN